MAFWRSFFPGLRPAGRCPGVCVGTGRDGDSYSRHARVGVRECDDRVFWGGGPRSLREIEGEPVVTRLGTDESIKQSGVQVGEVVLKVDGVPVRERMTRLGRYIPASTPQAHTTRSCSGCSGGRRARGSRLPSAIATVMNASVSSSRAGGLTGLRWRSQ